MITDGGDYKCKVVDLPGEELSLEAPQETLIILLLKPFPPVIQWKSPISIKTSKVTTPARQMAYMINCPKTNKSVALTGETSFFSYILKGVI